MFEHLDDPDFRGFDRGMRTRITRSAQQRRRRRRTISVAAVCVPVLAAGGVALFGRSQLNQLDRDPVSGLAPMSSVEEATSLSAPMTLLVVGSDRRSAGDDGFGQVQGSRADVVLVVRIDPTTRHLGILAIPSSLVIPGPTGDERVAVIGGDPSDLVTAVSDYLGTPINHYVEVEFDGFRRLIDLAGGVPIEFDVPQRDVASGLAVDSGCVELNGDQALAFVRSRHREVFDASSQTWNPADESGPRARADRQAAFVDRAVRQVLTADYDLADELDLATRVLDDLTVDEGLSATTLRSIFVTARDSGRDDADTITLPTHDDVLDDMPVLRADPSDVTTAVEHLLGAADDSTPDSSPADASTPTMAPQGAPCGTG